MRRKRIISSLLLACCLTVLSPSAKMVNANSTNPKTIAPKKTTDISAKQPEIVGKSAITVDFETGEIIYAKDIDTKRYPASITKLITGLVFAEHKQKNDEIPYTEDCLKQPEESLAKNYPGKIKVGETMNADDVMKTLLLFSANDAATMMADSVAGSSAKFSELMNKKAKELGLKSTHFVTPNGLHDNNHYTTAYDLSILSKAAFHNDWVRETMGTKDATVTLAGKFPLPMTNRNKNLGKDGCIGGKTGSTTPAGRCLTAIYEKNGRKIIGVVLKSEYGADDTQVFKDMNKIIDWSFTQQRSVYAEKGQIIDTVKATYKPLKFFGPTKTVDVPIKLNENVEYYANYVNNKETTFSLSDTSTNAWDLAKNSDSLKVKVSERTYSKTYAATADITKGMLIKANLGLYAGAAIAVVVIVFLIMTIIKLIGSNKRRRRRKKSIF